MNAIRLNSLSESLFEYKADETKNTIKVCSSEGKSKTLNREEIIAACRLATVEHFGRIANANKDTAIKYNSKLGEAYGSFQRSVWKDTVLYCAALANKAVGKEPYTSMKEVEADRGLYRDANFWRALQYISEEVITPLYPAVIPDATERLIEWQNARLGETKLINIESNDFFVFDDDSWGSVSSKPYQYLYKAQIAVTPKPYTAKTKINWYQDVVDGEAGRYFAALMRGGYSKMYAIMLSKFKSAVASTKYMPEDFNYDGYSVNNWNQALMKSEATNGVNRNQLMALGTLSALSNVLPTTGADGAIAGIQGMIGVEWARNGFLSNVAGVDLVEVGLGVVPGTQNYKPKFIGLDDATSENIYILSKVGRAPMVGAIAEGSPITITFSPEETADMTINISETLVFDIAPAFSSKIVKISV